MHVPRGRAADRDALVAGELGSSPPDHVVPAEDRGVRRRAERDAVGVAAAHETEATPPASTPALSLQVPEASVNRSPLSSPATQMRCSSGRRPT